MSAVSPVADRVSVFEAPPALTETSEPAAVPRWRWAIAVGALLLGSFALRLWGVKHGLPYAYNADENAHFVPKAIGLFGHGLNPDYFVNPPAYTYVLHAVFAVWFGGREGVSRLFEADPTEVWVVARTTAAVLGTLSLWLLYLAGTPQGRPDERPPPRRRASSGHRRCRGRSGRPASSRPAAPG